VEGCPSGPGGCLRVPCLATAQRTEKPAASEAKGTPSRLGQHLSHSNKKGSRGAALCVKSSFGPEKPSCHRRRDRFGQAPGGRNPERKKTEISAPFLRLASRGAGAVGGISKGARHTGREHGLRCCGSSQRACPTRCSCAGRFSMVPGLLKLSATFPVVFPSERLSRRPLAFSSICTPRSPWR